MMAGRAVQLVVGLVVSVLIGVSLQSFPITPATPPKLGDVAYTVWWGITALAGGAGLCQRRAVRVAVPLLQAASHPPTPHQAPPPDTQRHHKPHLMQNIRFLSPAPPQLAPPPRHRG